MKIYFEPNPFEFQSQKNVMKPDDTKRCLGVEWEEILVDTGASEPQKIRPFFNLNKMKWLFGIVICLLVVLFSRLFHLQIVLGQEYEKKALENRYRELVLKPSRGIIFDHNKNLLLENVPRFDVVLIPADFPKAKEKDKIKKIGEVLKNEIDFSVGDYETEANKINRGSYTPVLLKEDITRDQALMLEARLLELPGIEIQKNSIRHYLFPEEFAHILGYIGRINEEEIEIKKKNQEEYLKNDLVGKMGLELSYEETLRGSFGRQQVEVDSFGKIEKVLATKEPRSGSNLLLTLDRDFQIFIRQKLEEGAKKASSNKAAAVAINPKNGEILAIVSIPSFDNNLFTGNRSNEEIKKLFENEDKPLLNRPVSGVYPPGSTIKPVVALAALQEKIIDDKTVIVDNGKIDVVNKYNSNIVYHFVGWNLNGLGPMNVYSAIAKSSDIFFYYMGGGFEDFQGLGADKLYDYYTQFLMGKKTGLDLPSEATGLIPTPAWKEKTKNEAWYLGDNYHIAIGQGDLLITPLQEAVFTAAIASGGTVYKPHLVTKAFNQQDNETKEFYPQVLKENFLRKENFEIVKRAMRETVTSGSAKDLNRLPFNVAGKTGTAQFANNTKTHAWFTCFAPYEDPEIALVVLVEGGGEGQDAAVPIASEILRWYFENKKNR